MTPKKRMEAPFLKCSQLILSIFVLFLFACSEPSAETYLHQLGSRDSKKLREAAFNLCRRGNAVVPRLIDEGHSEDWRVRFMAAQLLGIIKAERATPLLIKLTEDRTDQVAKQAVWALGELHALEARPNLLKCTDHKSNKVAQQAMRGLGAMRPKIPTMRMAIHPSGRPPIEKEIPGLPVFLTNKAVK